MLAGEVAKRSFDGGVVNSQVATLPHPYLHCLQGRGTACGGGVVKCGVVLEQRGKMNTKYNRKLTPLAKTLRKNMTKQEKELWYKYLRKYPIKFYRQRVIDDYIADFYCAKAKIVIELDGSQHYDNKGYLKDKIRTERLENYDLTVIRIPNNEIDKNLKGVCDYIDAIINKTLTL